MPDDEKRYIGQIDLPLSEEGVRQAALLRARLDSEDISSIYCSDLTRTRQTSEIIAAGRDIEIIERPGLREINLGEWEGRTFAEIEQSFPEAFRARGEDIKNYRIAGGESFAECNTRVIAAFGDIISSSSGHIVICGHAGVNRLILCHVLGIPIRYLFGIKQDYGCINIIRHTDTTLQLISVCGGDFDNKSARNKGGSDLF